LRAYCDQKYLNGYSVIDALTMEKFSIIRYIFNIILVLKLPMQRQNFSLACLHRECELNYSRLTRLTEEDLCLGSKFHTQNSSQSIIHFEVIELAKFTTTLSIRIESNSPKWLPRIELKARIYRDAKMAEVIEWCSDSTIPWALVERKGPQSRDEKWQWNIFLGELLYQALRHRRIAQVQSS